MSPGRPLPPHLAYIAALPGAEKAKPADSDPHAGFCPACLGALEASRKGDVAHA